MKVSSTRCRSTVQKSYTFLQPVQVIFFLFHIYLALHVLSGTESIRESLLETVFFSLESLRI